MDAREAKLRLWNIINDAKLCLAELEAEPFNPLSESLLLNIERNANDIQNDFPSDEATQ